MATFTAKDVSELRQRTGAGMMECKKALEENEGNIDKSIEWLRKKGIAKAEKRAGRATSEGKILGRTSADSTSGVLVELNCETDFVSRNETFGQVVDRIADTLLATGSIDGITASAEGSPLMAVPFGESGTLDETLKHMTGTIGENIVLRRYARFSGDAVGVYAHHNNKIAAMVELAGASGSAAHELARTIAEHVAAGVPTMPVAVSREDVPAELVERERRIFTEQAAAERQARQHRREDGRAAASTSTSRKSRSSSSRGFATTARRSADLVKATPGAVHQALRPFPDGRGLRSHVSRAPRISAGAAQALRRGAGRGASRSDSISTPSRSRDGDQDDRRAPARRSAS